MGDFSSRGRYFRVDADAGARRIAGFRPGVDRCQIDNARLETKLLGETTAAGVALVLSSADGETRISFPGLKDLPLADMTVAVALPEGDVRKVRLSELDQAKAKPPEPTGMPGPPHTVRRRPITEFVVRPGEPIPSFEAFTPGSHLIEVALPGRKGPRPSVDVMPTPDGVDGVLLIDGRAAAILAGAPFATPADIRILPTD